MTRRALCLVVALCLGPVAACDKTDSSPTSPSTSSSVTIVFTGTLAPGGSSSFAFTLAGTVPVRLSFSSLTDAAGTPLGIPMRLRFGRPQGTGCAPLHEVVTTPNLATHIHVLPAGGTFCAGIADAGQLAGEVTFGVRITQGDPGSVGSPGTITYTSVILPGGFTARTFSVSAAGVVTVTLDAIDDPAVPALGVGIGFPGSDGAGCQITQVFTGTRGAQSSIPVELGTYCVRVTDLGTLTRATGFTLRIQHP